MAPSSSAADLRPEQVCLDPRGLCAKLKATAIVVTIGKVYRGMHDISFSVACIG
jgi:hypothetical protein